MSNFKEGNLEILLKEGDKSTMTWTGRSDDRDPSALLNPYIAKVIDNLKGGEIEVDFVKLQYMNSSTVPPIIQLIKRLDAKGVKAVIAYDKDSKWQCASFKALETIVKTMENIEVQGR